MQQDMWIPEVQFIILAEHKILSTELTVERTGQATLSSDMDSLHPKETYKGSENTIHHHSVHQVKFICTFENITLYPFDEENCKIQFYIPGTNNMLANLIPALLITETNAHPPSSVGQYAINKWTISKGPIQGGGSGIIVTVKLGRNMASIILVTYLPTILINIINQATNYVHTNGNSYELIMTINMTAIMITNMTMFAIMTINNVVSL